MKKIYLLFSILFLSSMLSSQTIDIIDSNGVSIVGDTIVFSHVVDQNNQWDYFEHKGFVDILNKSNTTMTIGLVRHEGQIVPNTYDYLCWGSQCFGEQQAGSRPYWDVNDSAVVAANDTASGLLGGLVIYHRPNTNAGVSIYRYELYDRSNRLNTASVYVKLNTSYVASLEKEVSSNLDLNIFPNPVEEDLNVQLSDNNLTGATVIINNLVGEKVYESQIKVGTKIQEINTSSLESGMYFVSIEKDGNRLITKRVIKK